jgi:outer membrane protein OmpA-like peptidoglycan-associated protein/uncharacterized protein YidB (DUF937 family)
MAQFDALISDIEGRFNLGANANSLIREILRLITGSPGGLGGFLDRFKSAGLGSEVNAWLGHPDASPLPANQVDEALGSKTLGMIASKLGMGVSAVSAIAGYTIPKLIGALTPGGIIPSKLSSDVMSFLSPSRTQQVPPLRVSVIRDDEEPSATGGWFWPLLAVLGAALLGFYLFSNRPAVSPSIVEAPAIQDDIVSSTNSRVMAALAALRAGFSTSDLTGILNQSTINFASGESQVPAAAMGFLASAAAQIKQLPANTVLEIAGYTVGDPSANLTLSQQRADAVRSELVRNGVAASMLVAKGYGEAKPIASNDSAEGRFRNRRIEYNVLQP